MPSLNRADDDSAPRPRPRKRTVTIVDLARAAEVSATTVSRFLNNAGPVSEAVQQRIRSAMDRLGYYPNSAARALRSRRTHTAGVVVPTLCDPYFTDLVAAIECTLLDNGYLPQVFNCYYDDPRNAQVVQALLTSHVDGVIAAVPLDLLPGFLAQDVPLVTVALPEAEGGHPNVFAQNTPAGHEVARLLAESGARRIAFLSLLGAKQDRRRIGLYEGGSQFGLDIVEIEVCSAFDDPQLVAEITQFLDHEQQQEPLDAVFLIHDLLSPYVFTWAEQRGLKIPTDLQVIGFDGATFTMRTRPELTTFRQPYEELGKLAVAALLAQINHTPLPELAAGPAQLVERSSTRLVHS